jgi:hypothetical protein
VKPTRITQKQGIKIGLSCPLEHAKGGLQPTLHGLTLAMNSPMVYSSMDKIRLHAVCFGPLARETYIHRFFYFL